MSLTVSGKKYLSLFSTPMVLEHLFKKCQHDSSSLDVRP